MTDAGTIVSISVSKKKGEKKQNIREAMLISDLGIEHDAHAEGGHRQVSLLMHESIDRMRREGVHVNYGDFAENIVTSGVDLGSLKLKDFIKIGDGMTLQVTMIGKECHAPCSIYYQVGYCIMPEEGIFCRVLNSGRIRVGDSVKIERASSRNATI
jgi:MOSC domain-containing protein YiiM